MKRHGHPVHLGVSLLGLLVTVLLYAAPAHGRLPYEDWVPANALAAVGIADTDAFWTKVEALPVTIATRQFLASPQISSKLALREITLERQKIEQITGYPLTPEVLFKSVFKDLLIYYAPPEGGGTGKPVMYAIIGTRDAGKAAKLLAALDKRNQEMSAAKADAATSGTEAAPMVVKPKLSFDKLTVGKTSVSHYHIAESGGQPYDGYYALANDKIFYSNKLEVLGGLIEGKAKPAETLAGNPVFKQLAGLVPWGAADIQGWLDGDAILKTGGLPPALLGNMPGLSKSNKAVFVFNGRPDGVTGQLASPLDPNEIPPNLKPRPLVGLLDTAPAPLLVGVGGKFNPDKIVADLEASLAQLQAMSGGGAGESPLSEFENRTGISVKQELVPALGHEVSFAINSIKFIPQQMPPIPQIDLTLGAEVRDAAKMKVVLGKLEKLIESSMPPVPTGSDSDTSATQAPAKFTDIKAGRFTVRTLAMPSLPGVSPSYVMLDHYLLISVNSDGLLAALNRLAKKEPSLVTAPTFTELASAAGTDKVFAYYGLDVAQTIQSVALPVLGFLGGMGGGEGQQEIAAFAGQVLTHIGTAASVEIIKDGASVGYVKIKMQ